MSSTTKQRDMLGVIDAMDKEVEKTYDLGDLSLTTQKEVKVLIYNLKAYNNQAIDQQFQFLKSQIEKRQVYVMFEPLLNCDPLTDHKVPKSLLPIYIDAVNRSLDELHNISEEMIKNQIIQAFGRTYKQEIDQKYKLQTRIEQLEIELNRFQNQASVQANIIQTLQQAIANEKQKFVKEIQAMKEQIYQRQRLGNKFEPDFNEIPQVQDVLQLPSLSVDVLRSRTAKEFKSEATKMAAELRLLKQQCQVLQKESTEGKKHKADLERLQGSHLLLQEDFKKLLKQSDFETDLLNQKIKELEEKFESQKILFEDTQIQKQFLTQQIGERNARIEQLAPFEEKYRSLNSEAQKLKVRGEKAQRDLEKSLADFAALKEIEAKLQIESAQNLTELSRTQTLLNETQSEYTAALAKIDDLVEQNNNLQTQLESSTISRPDSDINSGANSRQSKKRVTRSVKHEEVQVPDDHKVILQPAFNFSQIAKPPIQPNPQLLMQQELMLQKQKEQELGYIWTLEDVDDVMKKLYQQAELQRTAKKTAVGHTAPQQEHIKLLWQKMVASGTVRQSKELFEAAMKRHTEQILSKKLSVENSEKNVQMVAQAIQELIEKADKSVDKQMQEIQVRNDKQKELEEQLKEYQEKEVLQAEEEKQAKIDKVESFAKDIKGNISESLKKKMNLSSKASSTTLNQNLASKASTNQMNPQQKGTNIMGTPVKGAENNGAPIFRSQTLNIQNVSNNSSNNSANNSTNMQSNNQPNGKGPSGLTRKQPNHLQSKSMSMDSKSGEAVSLDEQIMQMTQQMQDGQNQSPHKSANAIIVDKHVEIDELNFSPDENDEQLIDSRTDIKDAIKSANKKRRPTPKMKDLARNTDMQLTTDLALIEGEIGDEDNGDDNEDNDVNYDRQLVEFNPQLIIANHNDQEIDDNLRNQIRTVASHLSLMAQEQSSDYYEEDQEDDEIISQIYDELNEDMEVNEDKKNPSEVNKVNMQLMNPIDLVNQANNSIQVQTKQNNLMRLQKKRRTISPQNNINHMKSSQALTVNKFVQKIQSKPLNKQQKDDIKSQVDISIDAQMQKITQNPQRKHKKDKTELNQQIDETNKLLIKTVFKNQLLDKILVETDFQKDEEKDQNNKTKQDELLQEIYSPEFQINVAVQNTITEEQAFALQSLIYNPMTIRRIVQHAPEMTPEQLDIIANLYEPSTQQQLQNNQLRKPMLNHLIIKTIQNQDLMEKLTNQKIKPQIFERGREEVRRIVKAQEQTVKEFNPVQFAANVHAVVINGKQFQEQHLLQARVKNVLKSNMYDDLIKGVASKQTCKQLLNILKDQQLMQIFLTSDFDKQVSKKLFKLYSRDSLRQLEGNLPSQNLLFLAGEVFLEPQICQAIFNNQLSNEELNSFVQRRRYEMQQIATQKQIKENLLDPELVKQMSTGIMDKRAAQAIYKTFYQKQTADRLGQQKFSKDAAEMISSVLYNPEYANQLRYPEKMEPTVAKMFAHTIYSDELLKIITLGQNQERTVKTCVDIVKQTAPVKPKFANDPFRVQIISSVVLNKQKKMHQSVNNDTDQVFVAHIPSTKTAQIDYTQRLEEPKVITIDRAPPSLIKTFQIPDRTYENLKKNRTQMIEQRRRIGDIRHKGKNNVSVVVVKQMNEQELDKQDDIMQRKIQSKSNSPTKSKSPTRKDRENK
ncbi:Conserved_hypothetical protein [Hexamita inflata]|uniref:Uncharacterized protein n=1 Tax=Hexamita inflata TaxID=28002 RepID=A0AA86NJG1_9EUKA|nr:Conserved hypothetical protein [Hexamita inflata]